MINNVLNEYHFSVRYELKSSGKQYDALIPMEFLKMFIENIMRLVLKEQFNTLQECWPVIMPQVHPPDNPEEIISLDAVPISLTGNKYERPSGLSAIILPHPDTLVSWLRIEIFDMNKPVYIGYIQVEHAFIHLIDAVAENVFLKELELGNIIYYDLTILKIDTARKTKKDIYDRAAKSNQGIFEIPKLNEDRSRIFFNKMEEEALPVYVPEQFNSVSKTGRGKSILHRVIVNGNIYQDLCFNLKLSHREENGGYLLGNVYLQSASGEDSKWVIEVTNIVPAEYSYGNSLRLLFTNESWSRVNKRIDREFSDKKIIGWYHTHLFPATDDFGLSELDQILHRQFFTKPWQIALLVNIEPGGMRELRSFQKDLSQNKLEETKYEILRDKDQHPQMGSFA